MGMDEGERVHQEVEQVVRAGCDDREETLGMVEKGEERKKLEAINIGKLSGQGGQGVLGTKGETRDGKGLVAGQE